ncbi:MAG: hypothetical protein NC925_04130, partial [Candidatus Omnitrophica bacterium]|nr:hypothetical protein [Candidatus Omnitrophota bacterium]
ALKIALLYILAHSLAKAGLFLCAGAVEHKTHTKELDNLGGLIKNLPITAISFLICAFSIIGLPPLLGFWPKLFLVFFSASKGKILATSLAITGALFTLLYLLRLFFKVFLGKPKYEFVEDQKFIKYTNFAFAFLSFFYGFSFIFWFKFLDKLL